MTPSRHSIPIALVSVWSGLFGCSGSSADPVLTPNVGGASNHGGSAAVVGGATNEAPQGGVLTSVGANTGSGGTAINNASGGQSIGGNATAGGTTSSSGGNVSIGGAVVSVGGGVSTGGKGGTTPTTGGAATTIGGTTSVGGKTGTGGVIAAGGKATGGGTSTTTGGTLTSAGGATSGGACVESTCGSHKWACWKVPTPVSENLPNPQSYTDNGDGTVTDKVTCLTWEKSPATTKTNWQGQYDKCAELNTSKLGGYSDWRLPTRMEMASITDITAGGYPKVFTVPSAYYATGSWWYKTILTNDTTSVNMAWGYGTNGFTSNAIVMSDVNVLSRCVRGNGTGEAYNAYAVEPANHYTIGTDAVTDNYTGLMWQRAKSPTLLDHAAAVTYCAGLTLDGTSGWRLPSLNELASTVNEAKVGGAIVAAAFPNNPNGCKDPMYWFWAAESSGSNFWGLSYCDGFTGVNSGASGVWNYFPTANARCVRNP